MEMKTLPSKTSLTEFLEANHKLLSVLGVLIALTIFTSNVQPQFLGKMISLVLLTAAGLTWQELVGKFPHDGTMRLWFFQRLVGVGLLGLVIYWILAIQSLSPLLFEMLLLYATLYVIYVTIVLLSKVNFLRRLSDDFDERAKRLQYPLWLSTLVLAFCIAVLVGGAFLTSVLLEPTNRLLESVRTALSTQLGP